MKPFTQRALTGFILILLFIATFGTSIFFSSLLILSILFFILIVEWPQFVRVKPYLFWLTPLYPVLPFVLLILLNNDTEHRYLLALSIILASVHDMGSFFAGKLLGRFPIAPRISPGKTWEGFIGGCILTCAVLVCCLLYIKSTAPLLVILLCSVTFSTLAFFGDLIESWFKRMAGLKDSGFLLPGHGGFLDRFDSTMVLGSCMYIFRYQVTGLLFSTVGM